MHRVLLHYIPGNTDSEFLLAECMNLLRLSGGDVLLINMKTSSYCLSKDDVPGLFLPSKIESFHMLFDLFSFIFRLSAGQMGKYFYLYDTGSFYGRVISLFLKKKGFKVISHFELPNIINSTTYTSCKDPRTLFFRILQLSEVSHKVAFRSDLNTLYYAKRYRDGS